MKKGSVNVYFYAALFVVTLVVGLLLAVQFRNTHHQTQNIPSDRVQELTQELNQLDKDIDKLDAEIADLEFKLEQAHKGQNEAMVALQDELTKTKLYAGYTAVQGPGVEIILPMEEKNGFLTGLSEAQDEILRLINELRIAGAEAISINGQRIISTSEVRVAGDFINVNLTRLSPPYHILALGNKKMKNTLEIPNGYIMYLRDLGVDVQIEEKELLQIPAYIGIPHNEFARIE